MQLFQFLFSLLHSEQGGLELHLSDALLVILDPAGTAIALLLLHDIAAKELGEDAKELVHVADQSLDLLLLAVVGPSLTLARDQIVSSKENKSLVHCESLWLYSEQYFKDGCCGLKILAADT